MKTSRFLQGLIIFPLLLIPFAGKKALKNYSIASLFICLIVILENGVAMHKVWWWYYRKPFKHITGGFSYLPLKFVSSLFTLKLFYGKFIRYLIIDTFFNTLYAFPILHWFKNKGITSFVRFSPLKYFGLLTIKSLLLYGFQNVFEGSQKLNHKTNT